MSIKCGKCNEMVEALPIHECKMAASESALNDLLAVPDGWKKGENIEICRCDLGLSISLAWSPLGNISGNDIACLSFSDSEKMCNWLNWWFTNS